MSMHVQKSIKEYTEEVQDVLRDLKNWEEDIKKEDKQLTEKHYNPSPSEEIPPIRKKTQTAIKSQPIRAKPDKTESVGKERKTPKISAYDYEAWDKFDVDKALESEEDEEEKPKNENEQNHKNKRQNHKNEIANNKCATLPDHTSTTATGPQTWSSVNQSNIEKADKLKEQGNVLYLKGKLSDAVAKYTLGIGLNPTNPLLPANRAMAYIKMKKFKVAEKDCTRSLQLDPSYIKAFLRRATARANLNNLPGAIEDYEKVLELEPWNKDATEELKKLKKKVSPPKEPPEAAKKKADESSAQMKRLKTEDKESLRGEDPVAKKPLHLQSTKPLVRIPVVEVNSKEEIEALLGDGKEEKKEKEKEREGKEVEKDRKVKEKKKKEGKKEKAKSPPRQEERLKTPEAVPSRVLEPVLEEEPEARPRPPLPKAPKTSHQFAQDWSRVSKFQDLAQEYLKSIPPSFFPGAELEVDHFIDVASTLGREEFDAPCAAPIVVSLLKSRGVLLNLAFLGAQEKAVVEKLIAKVEVYDDVGKEEIRKLKEVI